MRDAHAPQRAGRVRIKPRELHLLLGQVVSQVLHLLLEGMAARMFTQHQGVGLQADRLGSHDLVGGAKFTREFRRFRRAAISNKKITLARECVLHPGKAVRDHGCCRGFRAILVDLDKGFVQHLTDGVVHDKLAVKGLTGQGSAVIICWLFSACIAPTPQERHRWQCAARRDKIANHRGPTAWPSNTAAPSNPAFALFRLAVIFEEHPPAGALRVWGDWYRGHREQAIIEIGGYAEEGFDTYYVKDNGAGFDPAKADRLFMPFFRGSQTSGRIGHGLGLAIAREIALRHDGDIAITSDPRAGTSAIVSLPRL